MRQLLLLSCLLTLAGCAGQAATSAQVETNIEPASAASGADAAAQPRAMPATGTVEASPAARSWQLRASDWARPRSGAALVGMAPLPQVVRAWSAAEGRDIVILHAGGEEGELWARELRDWLVALGVPGERVRRVVGGSGPHGLQLELRASEVAQ